VRIVIAATSIFGSGEDFRKRPSRPLLFRLAIICSVAVLLLLVGVFFSPIRPALGCGLCVAAAARAAAMASTVKSRRPCPPISTQVDTSEAARCRLSWLPVCTLQLPSLHERAQAARCRRASASRLLHNRVTSVPFLFDDVTSVPGWAEHERTKEHKRGSVRVKHGRFGLYVLARSIRGQINNYSKVKSGKK
jgi:hypothetical protein